MNKSKQSFRKSKRFFRRRPPIGPGDQIDYRNMSLISQFISEQGKILSRRVNRLTLKQQRLITIAIKQARILSFLPFLNNEQQFKRVNNEKQFKRFNNEKQFKRVNNEKQFKRFNNEKQFKRVNNEQQFKRVNNEKQFERAKSILRTTGPRTKNK